MNEVYSFEPCAEPGQGHSLGHEILGVVASETLCLCSYLGVSRESTESSLVCRIHMEYYVVLLVAHDEHCRAPKSFLYPSFQRDFPLSEVFLRRRKYENEPSRGLPMVSNIPELPQGVSISIKCRHDGCVREWVGEKAFSGARTYRR